MSKHDQKKEYATRLQALDDERLVNEVADRVFLSAFASNNARSDYHWQCDMTHDEANRRSKPWLYQRGWNRAFRTAGHEPTEADIAAAREPIA